MAPTKLNKSDRQMEQDMDYHINDVKEKNGKAVERLRKGADYLDRKSWDFRAVHIVGGLLTVVAGVTIVASGGAAVPLWITGLEVAGVGIKISITAIEAAINSSEIKAAQVAVDEAQAAIDKLDAAIEKWRNKKGLAQLTYVATKLTAKFQNNRFALRILDLVLDNLGHSTTLAAKGMAQVGKTTKRASKKAAIKAAKQAGKKAIVVVNTAFVVWDALEVSFQIRDLIQEKGLGSEAANGLRKKADEMERCL